MTTPIRTLFVATSALHAHVGSGLDAVKDSHRGYIQEDIRATFTDSIDLDNALKPGREQENRWDDLLGWGREHVIALEPHSATNHEVKTVIGKKKAALAHLAPHVHPKRSLGSIRWFWVASGKNDLTPLDKKRLMLDQAGITFVAPKLTAKHLPPITESNTTRGNRAAQKATKQRGK